MRGKDGHGVEGEARESEIDSRLEEEIKDSDRRVKGRTRDKIESRYNKHSIPCH